MSRHISTRAPKLLAAAVATFAVTALTLTGGASASAQTAGGGHQDAPDQRSEAIGLATVLTALQRDLELTATEAERLLATQGPAVELNQQLQEELGEAFVGSWFDARAGSLTATVTDAAAAEVVAAAGAEPQVVARSTQDLAEVTERLDTLAASEPAAVAGVVEWGVDIRSNQVVVTVLEDHASRVGSLIAQFDDVVRIETTDAAADLAQQLPFLDGGISYDTGAGGCSVGFNLRNLTTGQGYFLTAGHCHPAGLHTTSQGIPVGPVVASFFPGFDDALVRVDNPFWTQGPWVWVYPGVITVRPPVIPPIGTAVCSPGRVTGLTCGVITAHNQTVNFGGQVVNNLTRHSICVLPGDSGAPVFTANGGHAVGIIVGTQITPGGQCLSPPVGWYQPLHISLPYYEAVYGVTLLTG